MDGLYVITSLSDMANHNTNSVLYWYKPYYLNFLFL
jgi:hypothetical protein